MDANGRDRKQSHWTPMGGTELNAMEHHRAGPKAKPLDAYGWDRKPNQRTPNGGTESKVIGRQ